MRDFEAEGKQPQLLCEDHFYLEAIRDRCMLIWKFSFGLFSFCLYLSFLIANYSKWQRPWADNLHIFWLNPDPHILCTIFMYHNNVLEVLQICPPLSVYASVTFLICYLFVHIVLSLHLPNFCHSQVPLHYQLLSEGFPQYILNNWYFYINYNQPSVSTGSTVDQKYSPQNVTLFLTHTM